MDFCFNLFRLKCVNPHPRPGPRFRLLCLDKKFPPPYVSWLQERVTTAQDFKCISHVYLSVFVYLRLWKWTISRQQMIGITHDHCLHQIEVMIIGMPGWLELWIIGISEYSSSAIIWIADTVGAVSGYPPLSAIQYHIRQISNIR